MSKSGIYKIVNSVNGKQYVGSAVDLTKRKCCHWSMLKLGIHRNKHLQQAWFKYGEDAFEFRIVGTCAPDKLIQLEQEVMDYLKPEYNIRPLAHSNLGMKWSEETKHRMSMALKGNTRTKGKRPSEETRRKLSEANMGKQLSEEHRHKISEARLGQRLSKEHRRKLSEAMLGNKNLLGYKHSIETRRKMSDAALIRWERKRSAMEPSI